MFANGDNRTGILSVLRNTQEHEFYLTGSKFFVGTGNDTDYFVADSQEVRKWLEFHGFNRIGSKEHNYNDTNCSALYRIICPVEGQVDVQCLIDVEMKNTVQTILKKWGKNPKSDVIWDIMFEAYREGYVTGLSKLEVHHEV